jgi:hypothetical protein
MPDPALPYRASPIGIRSLLCPYREYMHLKAPSSEKPDLGAGRASLISPRARSAGAFGGKRLGGKGVLPIST